MMHAMIASPQGWPGCAAWIEINAGALRHNLKEVSRILPPQCQLGVVLKSNAYGHGLLLVFQAVHSYVDLVYLVTPQDAFQMRLFEETQGLPRRRIIVLGPVTYEELLECIHQEVEIVLGDPNWEEHLVRLAKAQLRAILHIHLDTGLSREGFSPEGLEEQLAFLRRVPEAYHLKGVMSHFSNTEDVTEQTYAQLQLQHFRTGSQRIRQFCEHRGPLEEHIAASAATLVLPETHLSSIRLGISLYGLWPSSETRISSRMVLSQPPQLRPVLAWKCKSQLVKTIYKGSYVGYGCTFRCSHEMRVAIFPIGYFDGYPRLATGKAHVLIQQKRCRIIGRIMMNHFIVDVSALPTPMEVLEATLIGTDGDEVITAEMLASWAETIPYEVVARLGAHLRRVLVNDAYEDDLQAAEF